MAAMVQCGMITSEERSSSTPITPLEREQQLCNEALRSGDFDAITDSEWLALCESEADKARATAKEDGGVEAAT